jgi:ech hydrogenase subunit A
MTNLPLLLIGVPILFGLIVLSIKRYEIRSVIVVIGAIVQAGLALTFVVTAGAALPYSSGGLPIEGLDYGILGLELLMATFVAVISIRKKRLLPLILAIVQAGLAIAGENWTGGLEASRLFVADQLSLLMVFLVGIVGGLILFYSSGYMKTYHEEHEDIKDRRRIFACVMLVFLGAMYGIVISNDLRLMLLFWEMTTLASFLLIDYARTPEADASAFRALNMNLLGGISFAIGVILLAARTGTIELDKLIALGKGGGAYATAVLAAAAFLSLAGIVKSAQLPFTSWLLGAMVAPTPVSALLHSSTMVKAGVFLVLKMAPVLSGTTPGYLVAFVGAITFLGGAFSAVSERNAKRILALSTVSNLGLIVTCAGIGTYQLIWVAFFLILFHALAKALLFLGTGTASMGTGSLDVETMSGLVQSMPKTTILLIVGICAMFIAPFGMLVSKWAAMEAFINLNSVVSPIMIIILAYGSAVTVFFWTKWLGLLLRMPDPNLPHGLLETKATKREFIAEGILAFLTVTACVTFPIVSKYAVEPYILSTYSRSFGLDRGNAMVTVLMVVMVVAVPGILIFISRKPATFSSAYMSSRPTKPGLVFAGSKGVEKKVEVRNYYLKGLFEEKRILDIGTWVSLLLIITIIGTVLL